MLGIVIGVVAVIAMVEIGQGAARGGGGRYCQHRIGVTRRVGQAFRPQGMGLALKSSKVRWRGSQSKDGGGTHDDRFPARLPVLV